VNTNHETVQVPGLQVQTLKPGVRAQKKAASLTRDRFTTSKAIQEQQTQLEDSTRGPGTQENSHRLVRLNFACTVTIQKIQTGLA